MIDIKNLEYSYHSDIVQLALDGISLKLKKGDFVAVLGHNGSGKSTLAKHLNAVLLPTGGAVLVDDINTKEHDLIWDVRRKVGMVFQNPDNQIVATIVEEDIAFGPENLGIPSEQIQERVDYALAAVGMTEHRKTAPHMLSGGQKQRIAIAGVIAMQPDYIVLDEPTAMLDPAGRKEVLKTIKNLNKKHGITVILITHYMDETVEADRVIVMDKGSVVVDDIPQKVFINVSLLKSIGLDVPQVTDLMFSLRRAGLPVCYDLLTVEQCANEINAIIQAME